MYRQSFDSVVLAETNGHSGWLSDIRREAYDRFKTIGFPTKTLESWKTISLEPILGASFVSSDGRSPQKPDMDFLKGLVSLKSEEESRIVFVNGAYSEEYSSAGFLPHGVFLGRLAENIELTPDIVRPYLAPRLENETNAFSLINAFSFKDGVFVTVPKNTVLGRPLNLVFVTSLMAGNPRVFYPRILIVLGDHASADVVVNFIGDTTAQYFNNAHAEIHLGEGANLNYTYIQRESRQAFSFFSNHSTLKKESVLNVLSFSEGGLLVRNENHVEFTGERASASHKGLSVLSGESQVFHHAIVDHAAPRCTSRQYYKNILAGRSKSEFNSLVHVHRGAEKSDSNQLNKNLMLSDFAQSYSRPQLKIDADDVACTHGATVGQLEKDELFYLRTRGFSEKQARFALTYGFAEEILEELKPETLKTELETLVNRELQRISGEKEPV